MSDLIKGHMEALEEMQFITNKIYPRHNEAAKWAITALREQDSKIIKCGHQFEKMIKDEQKLQSRIAELEAALNVAVNGITDLSRGRDVIGTRIHTTDYARTLLNHVTRLWEKARAGE